MKILTYLEKNRRISLSKSIGVGDFSRDSFADLNIHAADPDEDELKGIKVILDDDN